MTSSLSFLHELLPHLPNVGKVETRTLANSLISFIFTLSTPERTNGKKIISIAQNQFSALDWEIFGLSLSAIETLLHLQVLKLHLPFAPEDKIIEILKKSPALHTIDMSGKAFNHSNALLAAIGSFCKGITFLNLSQSCKIDDQGIEYLKECRQLKEVNLSECPLITDEGLSSGVSKWTLLESFIAYNCPQIGYKTLHALISTARNLKYLNIGNCPNVATHDLAQLINSRASLSGLFLENLPLDLDALFNQDSYPSLKKLSLRGIVFDDQNFSNIAKRIPELIELNLSRCYGLKNSGLIEGLIHLPRLRILDIRGCLINPTDLVELGRKFASLTILEDQAILPMES